MGTSSSSRGSGSNQPMVPPWADDQPGAPVPPPPPKRFQAFRTSFGKFLKGGDGGDLRKSLGHYARTSTGGSAVGPRRFGSVYTTGGDLYDVLKSLGGDGGEAAERGLSKESLAGQPLDVVCQRLAETLAPENGDSDRIREAIDEAMLEVMGEGNFDPDRLDEETINRILGEYLSQSIFQEIVEEVGGSWANAPDEQRTPEAESELLEVIRVVVEKNLGPSLSDAKDLTKADIHRFMREAVTEVWREWESFDE
ncbi:hypothetical protein ABIE78_000731 [Sinorhizobium fredii]|uniref:Uncharacterized protein n=1 Tax=Sinorhizobium fredii (strain USDA 257) TaxID=1185652 RepID=I3XBX2_SINF2|nr:hypothetical protein [Sinorhizobium fredii]AFL53378.1 hypothetical protein USDA257_c48430 [Sinorhizobium fredii USDA 257]